MTGKIGRMGLFDRLFGPQKEARRSEPQESSQFQEAAADSVQEDASARGTPRRELVQVVLRETMRKHGIPSDWIECHILSVVSKSRGTGMHVQLVVRHGDDRLITYVHAFQESFLQELVRFDRRAKDTIFSLSWQFAGKPLRDNAAMPDPTTWKKSAPEPAADASSAAATAEDAELQEDLQALFAIRDAVLKQDVGPKLDPDPAADADRPDFEPTRPGSPDEFDKPPRSR
jgi:hypothetical protein